jgi:hypothetical protein
MTAPSNCRENSSDLLLQGSAANNKPEDKEAINIYLKIKYC